MVVLGSDFSALAGFFVVIGLLLPTPFLLYYPIFAARAKAIQWPTQRVMLFAMMYIVAIFPLIYIFKFDRASLASMACLVWLPSAIVGRLMWLDTRSKVVGWAPLAVGLLSSMLLFSIERSEDTVFVILFIVVVWHGSVFTTLIAAALPYTQRVVLDGTCACGYDLSGLHSKVCPECGRQIASNRS